MPWSKYINLADGTAQGTPQDAFNKGWCGTCFVSKGLREIFLVVLVGGFHLMYVIFSIFWLISYMEVSKDEGFKNNYTGLLPMSDVERHLFTHCILTGVLFIVGVLSLIHEFNEMMHGWFLYGVFKGVRFATISLTIILYVTDLIFWDDIKAYGLTASFYNDRTPQAMTFISMAGYVGMTHLTDQMNVMYLQSSYEFAGAEEDKTKTRSRFYGKYQV